MTNTHVPKRTKGAWMSPDGAQSLYHDPNHCLPIGPHTDWNVGKERWRIFPDGRMEKKIINEQIICKYILPRGNAAKWMQDSLREGPSLKISKMIDDAWRWNSSVFFAFAYANLKASRLLDFSSGGVVGNADSLIIDHAMKKYRKKEMQFFVEDWAIKKMRLTLKNFPGWECLMYHMEMRSTIFLK